MIQTAEDSSFEVEAGKSKLISKSGNVSKMNDTHEYADLHGNKFVLTELDSRERLEKLKRKSKKCARREEFYELIRNLFLHKDASHIPVEIVRSSYQSKTLRKYYQPGIIVQVDIRTTPEELQRLFHVGVRTVFVRLGFATPGEITQIMTLIRRSIDDFHKNKPYISPIGIAVEIRGHELRTGRVRNNRTLSVHVGCLMVLTCDAKYKYVCQREIIFVSNLHKYLPLIQLGDIVFINRGKIHLRVVKILNQNVTCCIVKGECIRSYMDVEMPYYVANRFERSAEDIEDVQLAVNNDVQFIVLPAVSSVDYIKGFRDFLTSQRCECDILASINTCIATNKCTLEDIVRNCQGIWINKLFRREGERLLVDSTVKCIIELGNRLQLPIVGKIPIKTRLDFIKLQHHQILSYLDSILIEKSPITLTFPLIARKLFCVQSNASEDVGFPVYKDNEDKNPSTTDAMAEPINFHISIQKCNAIIINSHINYNTAKLLSRKHIYCPIIVVAESEKYAKQLNIYRNMKVVLVNPSVETEEKRLEFGIDYGLWSKLLAEGDFLISFYDSIYHECVSSKYRALYVPKKSDAIEKYQRVNYICTCNNHY